MPRKVKTTVGFAGHSREIEVSIPDHEPEPLGLEAKPRLIGKRQPRVEAKEKVTGRARYTADIQLPGMLHAVVLRSPHARAKIGKIDISRAESAPGVKAVLTAGRKHVRFVGDPVAGVAAETREQAEAALELITVEYEPEPFVHSMAAALKPGSPKAKDGPNVGKPEVRDRGDVGRGFEQADVIHEATYTTAFALHASLEPHGSVAQWDGEDSLTVWDSSQATFMVRDGLAADFKLDSKSVRVITEHVGGGFGSKLSKRDYTVMAARLARQAKAPVRLVLSRREDFLCTGNRHGTTQKVKIGAKRDGTLTAIHLVMHSSGGVGGGGGGAHVYGSYYRCRNVRTEEIDVAFNAGPACPMRAPGSVEAAFGLESAMDELAEKLGMDPLELRRKNDESEIRQAEYAIGAEAIGWTKRAAAGTAKGTLRRGLGLGIGAWGGTGAPGPSVRVTVFRDGGIEVACGSQDIGTGTRTILAQVVAEELGCEVEDVRARVGDTKLPFAIPSGGSMTLASVAPPARTAAVQVRTKLAEAVAKNLGCAAESVEFTPTNAPGGAKVSARGGSRSLDWKAACRTMEGDSLSAGVSRSMNYQGYQSGTSGCQFAEVEVDTETGNVRVLRVVAVQDCGRVINRLTAESQVNGGIMMGLGYALLEGRVMDGAKGHMINANLEGYKLPGTFETPEIDVRFLDVANGMNNLGSLGLGEPPVIPTAPAIANAVAHALGVRVRDLPMTPDRVLAALAEA